MRFLSFDKATELYGKEIKDGKDTYKALCDSDDVFFWDYKTLRHADSDSPGDDFLLKLDFMLAPHGLEVVKIDFDGDAKPWFVDAIKR